MAGTLRFTLLRQVGAERDGVPVALARKPRALLAVLLLRAGRPVAIGPLAERIWGDDLPVDERGALQTYVNRLRAALGEDGGLIQSRAGGYLIDVGPDQLDLAAFEALVAKADRVAEHDPRAEVDLLQEALSLWGDDPLGDTGSETLERLELPALLERKLSVVERRIDAQLRLGLDAQLVPELRALTADHPLRERLWAQLMLALHRSGRRAAALSAYDAARRVLVDELGIEPGKELRELQQAILTGSESLDPPQLPEPRPTWPVHRQLPLEVADFTGREDLVGRIEKLLTDPGVPIVAVSGPPGAGKSALAIRVGHRLQSVFPDGQWYVGLAGAGENPRDPYAVLAELLATTGLATTAIPDGLDARSALLRSRLAGRRVLIVLDDAGQAAQVRPLLPGAAGSAVLITSRNSLAGLIALEGGHSVVLDQLAEDESAALVAKLLGPRLLSTGEAEELARLCGHLPLALRIAASNLAARPGTDPARYLAELRSGNRLAKLAVVGDPQATVRNAFEQSYRSLDAGTSRLFRLLGVVPGPDFGPSTAAALLDTGADEAEIGLETLAASNLVQQHLPGRFQFHDLLRLYAHELSTADPAEHAAAVDRMMRHYLVMTGAAAQVLTPRKLRLPPLPAIAEIQPPELTRDEARHWIETELPNLVAAITTRTGRPEYTWHLTDLLRGPFEADGLVGAWETAVAVGLATAEEAGDAQAIGAMYRSRGSLYASLGRLEDSAADLREAAAWARRSGDRRAEISALNSLGISMAFLGRTAAAYDVFRQARDAAFAGDDLHQMAMASGNVAAVLNQLGRPADALAATRETQRLYDELGVGPGESTRLHNLATIHAALGHLDEALSVITREIDDVENLGDPRDLAQTLETMAAIHCEREEFGTAAAVAQRGLAIAVEIRDKMTEAHLRATLGDAQYGLGRYTEAADSQHAAVALARETKTLEVEVRASVGLSRLELVAGDAKTAVEHAERAVALFETLEMRILQGTALRQLAMALRAVGEVERARSAAEQAVALHNEAGAPLQLARSRQVLREVSG